MPRLYTVGKVVDHRDTSAGVEYKVRWAGYSAAHDTWEPEANLAHCQEYIQEYIMRTLTKKVPRRSTRISTQTATTTPSMSTITADEEIEEEIIEEIEDKPPPRKKTRATRRKKNAPPPEASAKLKEPTMPLIEVVPPKPPVTSYRLRSTTSSMTVQYSDESARTEISRMGLSEARFRSQMGESNFISSTPFMGQSSEKTKLDFDDSSASLNESLSQVTTSSKLTSSSNFRGMSEEFPMGGDSDPSEPPFIEQAEENGVTTTDSTDAAEQPVWLQIGWKECVLASFLTGMGVVGYLCYCSDFCTYC